MISADHRRLISAVALALGVVAVVVMAVWGVNAATAPFGDGGEQTTASDGPPCPAEEQVVVDFVTRPEVTVSVYNTGKRKGRAGTTLNQLEGFGFVAGAIGNGEAGDKVPRAEVRTTIADDPKAELVALALGKNVPVVVTDEEYGPGVDVFIGDRFKKPRRGAPSKVKLPEPKITCS